MKRVLRLFCVWWSPLEPSPAPFSIFDLFCECTKTTPDAPTSYNRFVHSPTQVPSSPVLTMFNNHDLYVQQPEWKCSKIFRPWDNAAASTSKVRDDRTETVEKTSATDEIKTEINMPVQQLPISYQNVQLNECLMPYPATPEVYSANIANYLGLSPTDSMLLESMSQGYAFEEYTRILSQEQQAKLLQSKKQRPKKYKCPHCDVGFSNNGQLKGHIRIHTGERPFKCDEKECGKTFTRNEELTRHKRIHSGLRPYPCQQCGKRFGRKDHLKKHTKTHFPSRGVYAVPVMLPYETWASSSASYPFMGLLY